jgi:hypothetical protein
MTHTTKHPPCPTDGCTGSVRGRNRVCFVCRERARPYNEFSGDLLANAGAGREYEQEHRFVVPSKERIVFYVA